MTWIIKFIPKIKRELKKLDKKDSKNILDFLENEVLPLEDPRTIAIKLKKNLKEFYKFRVGNFRIIADIQDNQLLILVVRIANRKDVYKKKFKQPSQETKIISLADLKNKSKK
ncbi:MAG: type II toxin-antitoxin system RelE/ParE family toxin [Desulfobacula sp.]|nr:type II toxin-antitoxin system RelE/ParE family toxin [Desulfobacula sp.]